VPIVCRFLALSRRAAGPDFPLVGTNGVRTGTDAARMALAGASAVEVLSAVMLEGFGALTRVLTELDAALAERGLRLTDLVGRAADALGAYGDQPDRPGHWRDFVPRETLQP
jgi:dihydroorotate dehydrogenase (NAD+) catalytic subunit